MPQIGYWLSSEEHTPTELVNMARRAEEEGFSGVMISDHYHPWVDSQGNSPYVWSVLGGIAGATQRVTAGTGITCPTIRYHPAILAQAAATVAAMMPGRFFLGVGTGENLNEHILGTGWPPHAVRLEMLEEAMEVMRLLWRGGYQSHRGKYYTVENARLYTLPEKPVRIMVAAAGEESARAAGRIGDGYIGTSPNKKTIQAFDNAGGAGKPKHGQLMLCWAETEDEAIKTAHKLWPSSALPGELTQELPTPAIFEQAAELVKPEDVAKQFVCGPDPQRHLDRIRAYAEAGYDHIYLSQVGDDQEGFIRFYKREILPKLGQVS